MQQAWPLQHAEVAIGECQLARRLARQGQFDARVEQGGPGVAGSASRAARRPGRIDPAGSGAGVRLAQPAAAPALSGSSVSRVSPQPTVAARQCAPACRNRSPRVCRRAGHTAHASPAHRAARATAAQGRYRRPATAVRRARPRTRAKARRSGAAGKPAMRSCIAGCGGATTWHRFVAGVARRR